MIEFSYAVADPDFFAPLAASGDLGEVYRPSRVPDDWRINDKGFWTYGHREGMEMAAWGWKVHVSARLARAQSVVDIFTGICFTQDVAFRFLSNERTFLAVHHMHAHRAEGGKFCVAYPGGEDATRRLMVALSAALADEEGPFIPTDRRFPGSKVVHYQYGAYREGSRVLPDGTSRGINEGRRGVSFHLPEGVSDPFAEPDSAPPLSDGLRKFREYTFETALRHSNGGGVYRAVHKPTGRTVFIKEARDHNGLTWEGKTAPERLQGEWETLQHLHKQAPGLCPEPIDQFRVWEHTYLVTEHIAGTALYSWMVAHNPMLRPSAGLAEFADYHARCEHVISAVETALRRLHERGYVFGDVSPTHVQVDPDGNVRLVDFESAHRIGEAGSQTGTDGYLPAAGAVANPVDADLYGLSMLAQLLIWPMNQIVQRNPDALAHLYHDTTRRAPIPAALWHRVTRFHRPSDRPRLPTPEQVAEDPGIHLADLCDRIAAALLAMADPDHPDRVFPTSPGGYENNTLCVAYGTAGVVHALRHANQPVADGIVERLRRDAMGAAADLPPGFYVGVAGIAWVLADFGHIEEARHLLTTAGRHPLIRECATLAGGSAGLAMAHLHLYRRTRDQDHADDAAALAAAIPEGVDLVPALGPDNATGMLFGRTGIALMLQQLAHVTGDDTHIRRGLRILHDELDRANDPDATALSFPASDRDRRSEPYLGIGTAGVLRTVSRYLRNVDDERLAEALPRLLIRPRSTHTVYPGLYTGLSGLGFALSEHAALADDDQSRRDALQVAQALFKYAIPHDTGVRFLGDGMMRYTADLNNGSSGVLLFLAHLLNPRPDPLFTIDGFLRKPVVMAPPPPAAVSATSPRP